MTHSIVQGDLLPHLTATLQQSGAPMDLTGCTVRFSMSAKNGTTTIGGPCVVDAAQYGRVHYAWQAHDTDVVGLYVGQFRVEYGTGDTITVPTNGAVVVSIVERIGS